ncbi:MAG: DUF58 domain-containing protein [Oscillospiraceae bacterium]|nr:DUF58 domain-containing protein [Oscillospiraceae bacterium]
MWLIKLLYLAVVIGLAVFCVLYIDSLAVVLLLCTLILPVILKLCLLWVKFSTQASLTCNTASCTVNESVPISIIVESSCPLFFPKVYTSVSVCHAFSGKQETIKLRFPLHSRNITKLTFYVRPEYCGAVTVRLNPVRILDYLHLFHTKMKRVNSELELLVLPENLHLSVSRTAEAVYSPESNLYADKAGDDPSEIFDIREYHDGDAVSRIHWKLSSKSDKLFIREFGFPIEKHVLLLAEYLPEQEADSGIQMQQAQAFLTLVYSLAVCAAKPDMTAILAWHDGNRLHYQPLKSGETLPELFSQLYRSLRHMSLDAQDLHEILSGQEYSSVTLLTNDRNAELLPVLEKQTEASQKNLIILNSETHSFPADSVAVRTVSPDSMTDDLAGLIL